MSQNRVVVWWDSELEEEQWRVELQQQNSEGLYEATQMSADAGFTAADRRSGCAARHPAGCRREAASCTRGTNCR